MSASDEYRYPLSVPAPATETPVESPPPPVSEPVPSPAVQRFQSCRWRRPAENGSPECCVHRDVLPMAGARSFNPEAWCVECAFYKARRAARKRPAPDRDPYYYY